MSDNGYVQLRRGLFQHLREGRISLTECMIYVLLIADADPSSGIVWSCSKALAGNYGYKERTAREALEKLESKRYLKRFATPGKHGSYPIAINKYQASIGARKGMLLDAENTTDWHCPVFVQCEENVNSNGKVDGKVTATIKRIENREVNTSSSESPSATPDPEEVFRLQSPPKNCKVPKNGKVTDPAFASMAQRLIPFFLEKSGKRSYHLGSKPSRGSRGTRLHVITNGLTLLRDSIKSQQSALDEVQLLEKTESAGRYIIEEFCKSDWHMGRDPKTEGRSYDDLAGYAFADMATMERWLRW